MTALQNSNLAIQYAEYKGSGSWQTNCSSLQTCRKPADISLGASVKFLHVHCFRETFMNEGVHCDS